MSIHAFGIDDDSGCLNDSRTDVYHSDTAAASAPSGVHEESASLPCLYLRVCECECECVCVCVCVCRACGCVEVDAVRWLLGGGHDEVGVMKLAEYDKPRAVNQV
jgi:hypothetical protein